MFCWKFPRYLMTLLIFSAIFSCKNGRNQAETIAIGPGSDPSYKNLNDSIKQFPSDASLYLQRALRLTRQNAHELAFDDFTKAWTLKPDLDNALPLAANLEILGKHSERLNLLESLNHEFPSNEQVSRLLADAYASSGNNRQALLIYNQMIARDSLDSETHYEKGLLLEQLKDTSGAIEALKKAYSSQGVDTYGLELARLYAEQKNPRSIQICDYILKHDSAALLIDPLFVKGIYYSNMKQYPLAIAQFDLCIHRDWKTTDAYLEKGMAYYHMQKYNAAVETFNMAITVTNTDPDAYYWLGRSYESLNRKTDAVLNYRKAVLLDKNFSEAMQRIKNLDPGFAEPVR